MEFSRAVSEGYKVWIALAGVGLALLWTYLPRRWATAALTGLTIVAGLNYCRMDARLLTERVDTYDLIHYYLNAKYFDELGYYDLYPACLLADVEAGPKWDSGPRYMSQDDAGHAFKPVGHGVARGQEVREQRFTPDRWEAFSHDFLYLQREVKGLDAKLWREMLQDHGFNGTPAWTALARPIASVVPVEAVKVLGWIDIALLGAALWAIRWAYGGTAAWWTAFFLLVSYAGRWPTYTWAFMRNDWIAALLGGLALVKKGRPFWGGVLTGWSAASRLFPAAWLFGPFARGVALAARRTLHRPAIALALGFGVAVLVAEGAAVATVGADAIGVHWANMDDHTKAEQLSSRRIGLALALPFRGELLPKNIEPERKARIDAQKPVRFALAGLALVVLGIGLRRARDDEAHAFGFVPFFLLTTASYYYYVARAPLVAVHGANLERLRNRVGLALLLALEVFCNWAETRYPGHRVFLIGWLAWGLAAYVVVMAAWLNVEAWIQPVPNTSATSPAQPENASAPTATIAPTT